MPTILVADDDPDLRSTVQLLLEDEGYHVLTSSTGQETLHFLHTHAEKLIVLPDLSLHVGPERVINLIADNPALMHRHTCFLFTAAPQSDIKHLGRGWPVLTKPFDITTLVSTTAQYCSD